MRRVNFAILSIVMLGCGNTQEAKKSIDQPNCRSVVEAFLTTDTIYSVRPPLLLLKRAEHSNDTHYLHGEIISVNDSGTVFLRAKEGTITNPKPKFYAFNKIACLIDSNNQVVFGEWDDDPEVIWDVELICQRSDSFNSEPFSLILKQNRISSYCIDPGSYRVVQIKFSCTDEYVDESDSLKFSGFEIFENSVTYIGTIHSEYKRNLSPEMTAIPTNIIRRGGMAGGQLGVIGYLADQKVLETARRNMPFHGLSVFIDSRYKPAFGGNLTLRQSLFTLEEKRR